jgi:hypothetical protein
VGITTRKFYVREFLGQDPLSGHLFFLWLCCVITRRRNQWSGASLGHGPGPEAVRALSLGTLGFDRAVLTTFGLPPRRLALADQAQAYRVLAVMTH